MSSLHGVGTIITLPTEQEQQSSDEEKIAESFFDGVMEGDPGAAASALRQLQSLEGFRSVIDVLACLLASPELQRGLFDRRLYLQKRGRGRKRAVNGSLLKELGLGEANEFFGRVAEGDSVQAGVALSQLNNLEGDQLKLLADLLDNSDALPAVFQFRLVFKAKGRGAPTVRLKKEIENAAWRRVVERALKQYPEKKEAAVQHLMMTTKKSRSTIMDKIRMVQDHAKK